MLRDLDALSAADVRTAYGQAVQWFVGSAASVPVERLDERATGEWDVRELIAHTSRSLDLVTTYLDAPARRITFVGRTGYTKAIFANPAPTLHRDVAERARHTLTQLGPDLVAGVRRLADDVLDRLARTPDEAPCTTPVGAISLIDYLPSRVGELVVHTLDLHRALGLTADPPPLAVETTLAFVVALANPVLAILALSGRIGYDVFT